MTEKYTGTAHAYWQEQIQGWKQSGQSQKAYCRTEGVSYSGFCYWRAKLRERTHTPELTTSRFVPVINDSPPHDGTGLSIVLPNGLQLQGIETANLNTLMALLERLS